MPSPENAQLRRWLAQGNAVASGELSTFLRNEPQIRQIAQITSDVVVLSMTTAQAAHLRSVFANLVVEPDSSLEQFGDV
jgi:hypothetical protein